MLYLKRYLFLAFVLSVLMSPNLLFAEELLNTCNSNPASYLQVASGGGSNTCSLSISGPDEVTRQG
ncbi:MAG: hypothetical protein HY805_03640, partial [Nitrospirae bacterium]|nr:hypothetical protein [Nitrospirota bacterium]